MNIKMPNSSFILSTLAIELSTRNGYSFYLRSAASGTDIKLNNQTDAKVLLLQGTIKPKIENKGKLEDKRKKVLFLEL